MLELIVATDAGQDRRAEALRARDRQSADQRADADVDEHVRLAESARSDRSRTQIALRRDEEDQAKRRENDDAAEDQEARREEKRLERQDRRDRAFFRSVERDDRGA